MLVTGGAGFIGSAFIRYGMNHRPDVEKIVNLDALTYAADLRNLSSLELDPRYVFVQGDIRDEALLDQLCAEHEIDAIVHFAAESHVRPEHLGTAAFYETNMGGTLSLLEVVRRHKHIHFHHISTDEVYGALPKEGNSLKTLPTVPTLLMLHRKRPPIISSAPTRTLMAFRRPFPIAPITTVPANTSRSLSRA